MRTEKGIVEETVICLIVRTIAWKLRRQIKGKIVARERYYMN